MNSATARISARSAGSDSSAATSAASAALRRCSRADGELAFYACHASATTSLVGLVRVAGTRWVIEESFQTAKTEVGLDHYEVCRLLVALIWPTPAQPSLVLAWSRWRRRHQARSRRAHYQRREPGG